MKVALYSALLAPLAAALPSAPRDNDLHCVGSCQQGDPNALMTELMKAKLDAWEHCETSTSLVCLRQTSASFSPLKSLGYTKCVNGKAGEYPCNNADLLSFIPHTELGSKSGMGNDIWGWADAETGAEIAIVGQRDGTAFVDITKPSSPKYLGRVESNVAKSWAWRDIKVYKDHAYIVCDDIDSNAHNMQVFDLRKLRGVSQPQVFQPILYKEFGRAHNIAINEETGVAYAVGSQTCRGGLHMINITTPQSPKFLGCADSDGYTHDVQVVIYNGPDAKYKGKEIAFASNEDTVTIWDVTDKTKPVMLSRTSYKGASYTHQGWLTEDQQYFLVDDEQDELKGKNDGHTQTYIWDVRSLANPKHIGSYFSPTLSIDHNLYIKGNRAYAANYGSGLRIVDISNIAQAKLSEVAFFDVTPERDAVQFEGAWSVYPYFKSGSIVVNSIERGLFVVKPTTA